MNESLFLIQTLIVILFVLGSYKLGKEALMTWVVVQALIANLFVLKQINLFQMEVTASDAYAIGSLLGLNFIQEYYGKEEANRTTWICFFFMIFFVIASQLHMLFEPSQHDLSHSSFQTILSLSPRLLFASMSVFFFVQRIDILFFNFLKRILPHSSFAIRVGIALIVSQLLDTVLFSFVGLYGIVASITDIIIVSFIIKLCVICFFTSLVKWAKT